jgi:transcription elongation factor Elf1
VKLDLDSHRVDFKCPGCGHKLSETIGRVKRNPTIHCAGCGKDIAVNGDELRRAIDGVQRRLDQLARTIGSLGKRR